MSEPVNPLFEEEKEFLERKKLEYERALRGDVEQLKEQTVQVGKVALVGAGIAGGIWLLSKAFGGGKKKRRREAAAFDYEPDDYTTQHFADFDEDAENERWLDHDRYFGSAEASGHGSVYHTDTDHYDDPAAIDSTFVASDGDDNGLGDGPDSAEHSSAQPGDDGRPFWSEEHSHPSANLPYRDSRPPAGDDFTDAQPAASPKPGLGTTLVAFAKSDLGKVLLGQALSIVAALATKALKDRWPTSPADTAKTSDLANLTGDNDGYAHGHPATPQPAAPDAYSAPVDDLAYREPLA